MTMRQFVERYGIALGALSALALLLVVLPGNTDSSRLTTDNGVAFDQGPGGVQTTDTVALGAEQPGDTGTVTTGPGGTSSPGSVDSTGTRSAPGSGPVTTGTTPAAAPSGGPVFGSGPNCRPDGRQKVISSHAPPCVAWTPGSPNGGATDRGVSSDKIVIVRYLAQIDPGTKAILTSARLADEPAAVKDAYTKLFHYSNVHYETYGREVVFVDYEASGPSESEEAMKADALDIATRIKPFAVIDGDPSAPLPNILGAELSDRGVPCACLTSVSSAFYTEHPLIPSSLPAIDEYAAHTAEYIAKKLAGKPAEFAGAGLVGQPRKFGLIYLQGARGRIDPEGARARDAFKREFARYGLSFAKEVGYIYDPGRNSRDVTNLIAQMKNEGITTIVPYWDPLYPILITKEATNQLYFPEWFMVGTGLSDTTTAGRLYDQQQWNKAFGISPLWVTWEQVSNSPGYREYHHAGMGGTEPVLINVYRARIETLFLGIQMAGPNLTVSSFMNGLYAYPVTGGTAGKTLRFYRPGSPTEIKDFAEVWYDADRQGPDERGDGGLGMVMKANAGRRYQAGQWTTDPSRAFVDDGAVAISDTPEGGGPDPHERDGHTHPDDQRCLSCG